MAIEPEGSVIFGGPSKRRFLPGLGASRPPELASLDNVSDLVRVSEPATIEMCQRVLKEFNLFVGPSTGTVLQGVMDYFREHSVEESQTVVAISPDFGDKYLDTVYNDAWVSEHFPQAPELVRHREAVCVP